MILLYLVALSTTDQYLYIAGNWVELKKKTLSLDIW